VTDDDVYISTDRGGLRRLDRSNGRMVWQNRMADRFLAANPRVVYAADRAGHLLILDRASGEQIGSYDTRDFVVPITNDLTDRVYMAANDGLLISLHDVAHVKPHINKKWGLDKAEVKKRGGNIPQMPKPTPPQQ
jgi:outer membrane protein assembly factor BamB